MDYVEPYGNPILTTDSYKPSHYDQLPSDVENLHAYLEARVGARYSHTMNFGLQYILNHYFDRSDCPITSDDVKIAGEFWKLHGEPFNHAGWMRIVDEHGGRLPLTIRAPKEGLLIPIDMPLLTCTLTKDDPQLAWLVTYVEMMLMRLWYPMSVATKSFFCKDVIRRHLIKSAQDPEAELPFKLHDFGGRGATSDESAGVGAMAHLINFLGTDTVEGIMLGNVHYPAHGALEDSFRMLGFSIPAMEHSTVIAWGKGGEVESLRNMLRKNKEKGFRIIACISDTYDFLNCVENIWCGELLEEVKASGMTVVVRPDSGDAVETNREALKIFARKLNREMTFNSKGFAVIPRYYRLIQGDGNDDERDIDRVYTGIETAGFSSTNVGFGMGGGLHQKLDRDMQRFAYKVSAAKRSGRWIETRKIPKTDPTKASKGGRVALAQTKGRRQEFVTVNLDKLDFNEKYGHWDNEIEGYVTLPMEDYLRDGDVVCGEAFEDVRARAGEQRLPEVL